MSNIGDIMKCQGCGNEIKFNQRFCPVCGSKAEEIQGYADKNALGNGGYSSSKLTGKGKGGGSVFEKTSYSPVGTWSSEPNSLGLSLELKFQSNGDLKIGTMGVFTGGLRWEDSEYNTYYISGSMPGIAGFDLGEIGTEAVYDEDDNTISLNIGGLLYSFYKTG